LFQAVHISEVLSQHSSKFRIIVVWKKLIGLSRANLNLLMLSGKSFCSDEILEGYTTVTSGDDMVNNIANTHSAIAMLF